MSVDLMNLFSRVRAKIGSVDFSRLWRGFYPLKFALYTDDACVFDGQFVEKTQEFLANTSIFYRDEYIAIWKVSGACDESVLASKLIHEMFHAFQNVRNETRFANEMDALVRYQISAANLSARHEENLLLVALQSDFRADAFERFLSLRKARAERFPYEYAYEAAVEQIEGSANFVEMQALKQLAPEKARRKAEDMAKSVAGAETLLPVRIQCYDTGAMLFNLLRAENRFDCEAFSPEPASVEMLKDTAPAALSDEPNEDVSRFVERFQAETDALIARRDAVVAEGDLFLLGANVYDARCQNGFVLSNNFVMILENGNQRILTGENYAVELTEGRKACRVYSRR